VFALLRRPNKQKWITYFKEQAAQISAKISTFNKIQIKAVGMINDISSKTSFNLINMKGNENEVNLKKIESIIGAIMGEADFLKIISEFLTNINEEFKQNLTVESITNLQDNMGVIFEQWYSENGFSTTDSDDQIINMYDETESYFEYPSE
jgi:hypothetical protein